MAWTTLSYGFGSLLTSTKMTQAYDNFAAFAAKAASAPVLADGYVVTAMYGAASVGNAAMANNAINTAQIVDAAITTAKLGALSIPQGSLNTAVGSVASGAGTPVNLTLPGGTYGFYPQVKAASGNMDATIANTVTSSSYITNITVTGRYDANVQQRYIQASPPYMVGNVKWGHFLFLLRDIATGTVKAAYEAEDPPWAYNGAIYLPKDDTGRLAVVPHSFTDYHQRDPAVDGLEIVMVDLTKHNTDKWCADNAKLGKGILEDLSSVLSGRGTVKAHADYQLPRISHGFSDVVKIIIP